MTAYSEIEAVNFSTLKHMDRGAIYYKNALKRGFKQTAAMAKGSAVHCLVLEPHEFNARYCINDQSRYSTAFKDAQKLEAEAGRTMIKSKDVEEAKLIAASVMANPEAAMYLNGAEFEKTLEWEMHGFKCKGRVDAMKLDGKPVLIDPKTTTDPQAWAFGKQVYDMKYHVQMAFYAAGMVEQFGIEYPKVLLIAVGNTAPYECIVHELDLETLDLGEQTYMKWLDALKQCREDDSYPSSYPGTNKLRLPGYAYGREETEPDNSVSLGGKRMKLNEETGLLEVTNV